MRSLLRIMLGVWVLQSIAGRAERLPRERAVELVDKLRASQR